MSNAWSAFYWRDYIADTGHLSLSEHGAYLLLMAHYYTTGKPIPADMRMICRLTRCSSHPRHASHVALQTVLTQFFRLDTTSPSEPVYRHKRIDRELAEQSRISLEYKERAKTAATARWQRRNASSNASSIPQAMLGDAHNHNHNHK